MKKFLYFAYGSNMNEKWMKKIAKSSNFFNKAILKDYKFKLDQSGVATVKPSYGSHVEGILWEITEEDLKSLDKFEGYDYGFYKREIVDLEVANDFFNGIIYVSLEREDCKPPFEDYVLYILESAMFWNFSKEYIQEISDWI